MSLESSVPSCLAPLFLGCSEENHHSWEAVVRKLATAWDIWGGDMRWGEERDRWEWREKEFFLTVLVVFVFLFVFCQFDTS